MSTMENSILPMNFIVYPAFLPKIENQDLKNQILDHISFISTEEEGKLGTKEEDQNFMSQPSFTLESLFLESEASQKRKASYTADEFGGGSVSYESEEMVKQKQELKDKKLMSLSFPRQKFTFNKNSFNMGTIIHVEEKSMHNVRLCRGTSSLIQFNVRKEYETQIKANRRFMEIQNIRRNQKMLEEKKRKENLARNMEKRARRKMLEYKKKIEEKQRAAAVLYEQSRREQMKIQALKQKHRQEFLMLRNMYAGRGQNLTF